MEKPDLSWSEIALLQIALSFFILSEKRDLPLFSSDLQNQLRTSLTEYETLKEKLSLA